MKNTPHSQHEMPPAKNAIAMAALIFMPLLISSLLWLVMPSGYRNCKPEVKDKSTTSLLTGWHPMQPALRQVIQIINP